ncbi:MoxR family ATPase [Microvenator marinus]|uniref:MoxR family ATPase n=1 Tax=Microvenator marinus TaxID=2600177 RepID=A0A5B8XJG7_9DELT|nr:MoxR family ATPase [Microvenator marinus]QED25695.1 MoxR family ATPase [Microvenator marinus]
MSQTEEFNAEIKEKSEFVGRVQQELSKVIVGQDYMVQRLMIGLLTGGHVLLEGVPGLAKTLTVKSLSDCFHMDFSRIQFTPDLLPADLVGTMIYDQVERTFVPRQGPVFTNFLLADEINRAPAKVQSALLESMQERQVTLGDRTYKLPSPFLVLATQNPIEQEGTYPLPEAQVDRFMLMLKVGYPTRSEERQIMDRIADQIEMPSVTPVAGPEEVLSAQSLIRKIFVDEKLRDYIVDLIVSTREPKEYGLNRIENYLEYGASPRATIFLNLAARAHAFINHRGYVTPEDIKSVAPDILRHRVVLSFQAEAEEVTSEDIVHEMLETIEVP